MRTKTEFPELLRTKRLTAYVEGDLYERIIDYLLNNRIPKASFLVTVCRDLKLFDTKVPEDFEIPTTRKRNTFKLDNPQILQAYFTEGEFRQIHYLAYQDDVSPTALLRDKVTQWVDMNGV